MPGFYRTQIYSDKIMKIRLEKDTDIQSIWKLNSQAFPTDTEANLVNSLRDSGVPIISIVAEEEGEIVGHILFSPVNVKEQKYELKLMGLAPMAVAPRLQNKGIGSQLIKTGLSHCIDAHCDAVVVLGYPDYYCRFGFVPAVKYGISSEYDVPDEVFMIIELKKGVLEGKSGIVKYHSAFDNL